MTTDDKDPRLDENLLNRERIHEKILYLLGDVKKTLTKIEKNKIEEIIKKIIKKINDDDLWLKQDELNKCFEDNNINKVVAFTINHIIGNYKNLNDINKDLDDNNHTGNILNYNEISIYLNSKVKNNNIYNYSIYVNFNEEIHIECNQNNNLHYNNQKIVLYSVFKKLANEIITEDKFLNKTVESISNNDIN